MPKKTELQKYFDHFNNKYFDSRLHDIHVRWATGKITNENLCGVMWSCESEYEPLEIVIQRSKRPWVWKLVLLHEMVHADLCLNHCSFFSKHGVEFNEGMLKLANQGALVGIW